MSQHSGFMAGQIVQPARGRAGEAVAGVPRARAGIEGDRWTPCDSAALVILSSAVLWSIIFGTAVRLIG